MSNEYHILKKRYEKMAYIGEKNNQGHLCIKVKHIDLKYLKNNHAIFGIIPRSTTCFYIH